MESINQKSILFFTLASCITILSFFNKNDGSKPAETDNSQNESDANINGANVESLRSRKRLNEDTLMIPREARKQTREFVRQYHEKYLEFGFTVAPGNEQCPQPLCLVCSQILLNDAMKPSKLIRHFHSKHSDLKGKPLEYFERLLSEMTTQKKQIIKITSADESLLHASFQISFQIAKTKKKRKQSGKS